MCEPTTLSVVAMAATAASGVTSAVGQYQQGVAQQKMYDYQAALSVQNSKLLQQYADEEKKSIEAATESNITQTQDQAAEQSKQFAKNFRQLSGTQKATIGALGLGGSTAEALVTSSFDEAKLDEMAIRYNANIKSWNLKESAKQDIWSLEENTKQKRWALDTQASMYRTAGKNAKRAGQQQAFTTLLSTAASVAMMGSNFLNFGSTNVPSDLLTKGGIKF